MHPPWSFFERRVRVAKYKLCARLLSLKEVIVKRFRVSPERVRSACDENPKVQDADRVTQTIWKFQPELSPNQVVGQTDRNSRSEPYTACHSPTLRRSEVEW